MPWTPVFWMTKSDFDKVKKNFFDLEFDVLDVEVYRFRIFRTDGVVICGRNQTNALHRMIHEVIKDYEHYILTSEPECCENGYSWGDEIEMEDWE